MHRFFSIAVLLLATACLYGQDKRVTTQRLKTHVYTLAADSMMGRYAGSQYARKAAEYIMAEFKQAGIEPYTQRFTRRKVLDTMTNVVGVIPGVDPALKDRYIVVGAHYDHIGVRYDGQPFNGADDNASGVAALIELARAIAQGESCGRGVILAAFDGEEQGLLGSEALRDELLGQGVQVDAMISIDMVGWLKKGSLTYANVATFVSGEKIFSGIDDKDINVIYKKIDKSLATGSDHDSFVRKRIPALYVTTGLDSPYHKVTDDANKIDYDGLYKVAEHIGQVVQTLSVEPSLRYSGRTPQKHALGRRLFFTAEGGMGSSKLDYNSGPMTGKPEFSSYAGLGAYMRLGKAFSLVAQPAYEWRRAHSAAGSWRSDNVVVPLSVAVTNNDGWGFRYFLTVGAYYGYSLWGRSGDVPADFSIYNRSEWGMQVGASVFIGRYGIGCIFRDADTNALKKTAAGQSNFRNRSSYFTLSYVF